MLITGIPYLLLLLLLLPLPYSFPFSLHPLGLPFGSFIGALYIIVARLIEAGCQLPRGRGNRLPCWYYFGSISTLYMLIDLTGLVNYGVGHFVG